MKNKLTDSQMKGVMITDRDLCVVAGPGSGKTRVLVERFANLVTTGKASIDEILTLTFTEKAANEMKVRAADLFRQKGMEQERQEIEFAYLSTIHGFCARILRENAIEAGVDPQFRIVDELESGRVKEQALESTFKERIGEETINTLLNDIFWKQADAKKSRLKSFRDNMMQLYEKIRSACVPISETVNQNDLSQDILSSYDEIERLMSRINEIRSEDKVTDNTIAKIENILEYWSASGLKKNLEKLYKGKKKSPEEINLNFSMIQEAKDIESFAKGNVSKKAKEALSNLKNELKKLNGLLVEDYSTSIKFILRDFLVNFDIAYSELKKVEGLIDFTDLEVKTIELLENREYIANEIKRKFKYILVDEFQDISGLQKKIIDLVRGKDNLFIVGDAKQSIYGFRNADVEIFQDIQNDIDPGSLISLNENFRSRPQILDFVNHIFNELWPGNSTSQDSTQQLRPGAEFSKKTFPSIEVIVAEGKDKTEARKWESMEIAKRIKEIVDKGEIKITNRREQERNISYRDFAVLFRSTTDIKLYEQSLSHLDIPYYVVSGRGFYNSTEITDLINLLKVIESPLDEINMAAVLKSPFVGIDDDALFRLVDHVHSSDEKRLLYQSLDEVGSIKEIEKDSRGRIIQFTQLLNEVQNIKPRIPLWKLISFILKKTEFQSKMLLFSNGKKRYANLRKLVELCKIQEEFESLTLRDFIEIVEGYKFREIRESEASVESEEDDVVKMITTHSAKGLEFPVVIVADTDRDNSRPPDYFIYSKNHGISFKILNPSTNDAEVPLSYERINDEITQKELQESKRLFFVAMTRAQEHLILSGGINKGRARGYNDKGNWHNYISTSLGLNPELEDNTEVIKIGQDPSQSIEIRHLRVKEENKPSAQNGARPRQNDVARPDDLVGRGQANDGAGRVGKTKGGKRIKLLARHRKEIAACDKIKTTSPSKEIVETGKNILSRITHNVEIDNSHYVYSVTELLKFHYCPQLYYLNSILGLQGIGEECMTEPHAEEGEDESRLNDDEIPGHELGNIVHRVFSRYDFPEDNLNEYIKKELSIYNLDTNQESVDLVANWVNSFYNSDVGKEVLTSKWYKRERSFIFNHRHNLIRGQIDLFYFNERGLLKIIDYKANNITIDEISEKVKLYQLQMQLYARALESIYGQKVDETILYFLVPDKPVVIDTSDDACKELDVTLNSFFRVHKDGAFKKVRGRKCEWCEYENIC